MSTRCNIVITDQHCKKGGWCKPLWFYRHSDGYPSGAMPTLAKFLNYVADGKIRNNPEQSAGWLILFGADEYGYIYNVADNTETRKETVLEPSSDWKCGAYEPAMGRHGDIEFLYVINLSELTIKIYETSFGDDLDEDYLGVSKKDKLIQTWKAHEPIPAE